MQDKTGTSPPGGVYHGCWGTINTSLPGGVYHGCWGTTPPFLVVYIMAVGEQLTPPLLAVYIMASGEQLTPPLLVVYIMAVGEVLSPVLPLKLHWFHNLGSSSAVSLQQLVHAPECLPTATSPKFAHQHAACTVQFSTHCHADA